MPLANPDMELKSSPVTLPVTLPPDQTSELQFSTGIRFKVEGGTTLEPLQLLPVFNLNIICNAIKQIVIQYNVICTYMHVCVRAYVRTYVHTYVHTYHIVL
jgi:hypothetical protein